MDMLLIFGIGADSSTFELPCYTTPNFETGGFQNGGFQNGEIQNGLCREPWPYLLRNSNFKQLENLNFKGGLKGLSIREHFVLIPFRSYENYNFGHPIAQVFLITKAVFLC